MLGRMGKREFHLKYLVIMFGSHKFWITKTNPIHVISPLIKIELDLI